jgi:hypothetical protein
MIWNNGLAWELGDAEEWRRPADADTSRQTLRRERWPEPASLGLSNCGIGAIAGLRTVSLGPDASTKGERLVFTVAPGVSSAFVDLKGGAALVPCCADLDQVSSRAAVKSLSRTQEGIWLRSEIPRCHSG